MKFYGHGKLLLTGEYEVLDGATALALPKKKGQRLNVKKSTSSDLLWESYDVNGKLWFKSTISLFDFSPITTTNEDMSVYLTKLLKNAVRLNSEFLSQWNGFKIETHLEFPTDWGLGSSSTLIYMVAEWAEVNPLLLYYKTEDGSGYDVACAFSEGPITFINSEDEVSYTPVDYAPSFAHKLYFLYSGQKASSAQSIKAFLKAVKQKNTFVQSINHITEKVLETKSFSDFETLIAEHENIVHKHTGFSKIKDSHFIDYWGQVKSLGAWGGDFILATSDKSASDTSDYFKSKGLHTILSYKDIIL